MSDIYFNPIWDVRMTDTSLRDGSHHKRHQFTKDEVHAIVAALDAAGVPVIEVTHGDGLGGSSFNYGFSKTPEQQLIKLAADREIHLLEIMFWRQFLTLPLALGWVMATTGLGALASIAGNPGTVSASAALPPGSAGPAYTAGRYSVNWLPLPSLLVRRISPPRSCASSRLMASPRPVPP